MYALNRFMGRLPGGLAIATQVRVRFWCNMRSNTATAATMGNSTPEMKKYGYDDSLSTASVALPVLGVRRRA